MADQTFAERVAGDQPRLPPGADDARSARPIERARFKAYMIGGFPPGGARGAIADVGVVGLGETSTAIREIVAAGSLPVSVDGDDRYGDVKTGAEARTVATCRLMGARAIRIEDRVEVERCGHMEGKEVVPLGRGVAHVRAAKDSSDLWSPGRTDARREYGRDAALRGAEAFIEVGADGVFVDAPTSVGDVEPVGSAFDVVQPANMLEGGPRTAILKPGALHELGFDIVAGGVSLLMRAAKAMRDARADLHAGGQRLFGTGIGFAEYRDVVTFDRWVEVEARCPPE